VAVWVAIFLEHRSRRRHKKAPKHTHTLTTTHKPPPAHTQNPLLLLASQYACAGALCQEHKGKIVPIEFYSKVFNKEAQRYTATERECLGLKHALENWSWYLLGSNFNVILYSDHQALQALAKPQPSRPVKTQRLHPRTPATADLMNLRQHTSRAPKSRPNRRLQSGRRGDVRRPLPTERHQRPTYHDW
jgi:hypothetical protein